MEELLENLDVSQYYPFLKGIYDVSPALKPLMDFKVAERLFSFDRDFPKYRENKLRCRKEIDKYYLEHNLSDTTVSAVNKLIVENLCYCYPDFFQLEKKEDYFSLKCFLTAEEIIFFSDYNRVANDFYLNLFDALTCQIQEDLSIWQSAQEKEWLAAIYFCCPNNWRAEQKIGRDFADVHFSVPGMQKWFSGSLSMLHGLIKKGPFERFNWELKDTDRLNLYPEGDVPSVTLQEKMFVRVERQLLKGLPDCDAVLFIVRTYIYDLGTLEAEKIQSLIKGLNSMSSDSLKYKGLSTVKADILNFLEKLVTSGAIFSDS